ncbi:unnamed protein product [Arabis nemorensis]|uniref:Uncharacterized protein n=1 Tax=Arabis nemorensis TaxID=586526 RepID=A0A565ATQ3_9BRAS|nr:unnamed protein product [Arabis nemorensis]
MSHLRFEHLSPSVNDLFKVTIMADSNIVKNGDLSNGIELMCHYDSTEVIVTMRLEHEDPPKVIATNPKLGRRSMI